MGQNNKKILAILFILIVLFSLIAVTYAFFAGGVNNDRAQTAIIETGTMKLTFADNDAGISGRLNFGDSITKKFTLENTGTVEATVDLYWKELTNTYLPGSLMYKLEYATSENGTKSIAMNYSPVPTSETSLQAELATQQTVPIGTKYYYTLTITLINSKTIDQTADISASFASGFTIESVRKYPMLANNYLWYTGTTAKSTITKINFVNQAEETIITTATESWPAAVDKDKDGTLDNDIMCYVNGTVLTISGDGSDKILANTNSAATFSGSDDFFNNVTDINGTDIFDTSKATTVQQMFHKNTKLKNINMTNWNISNVETMYGMFAECSQLTSIDLSNWNTYNVTDMGYIFYNCLSLNQLNLNSWNTANATDMSGLFSGCEKLKQLNINKWDTSQVKTMEWMFEACYLLTTVDIAKWDTSKVESMKGLFNLCWGLTNVDLSNWNTSHVTSMKQMFYGCISLKSLDLSKWDVSKVTDMMGMFSSHSETKYMVLTSVGDISKWKTENVQNMSIMFRLCGSLTKLNLKNWDVSKVTNMNTMFLGAKALTEIDVTGWNVSSVTDMLGMFAYTSSLNNIIGIENWNTNNSVNKTSMFDGSKFTNYPSWYSA